MLFNLKNLLFSNEEHYLFIEHNLYKRWWLLIKILVFFNPFYKTCCFYRQKYKFYKNVVVVGVKKTDKKIRRRTKGFSKSFVDKNINSKCIYCECKLNHENASADHIVPISKGGNNNQLNLIVVCKKCNNERGNLDFLTYLRLKNPNFKNEKCPFV